MIHRHKYRKRNEICARPSYKDTMNPSEAVGGRAEHQHQTIKGGNREESGPDQQAGSETHRCGAGGESRPSTGPGHRDAGGQPQTVQGMEPTAAVVPCPAPRVPSRLSSGGAPRSLIVCAMPTA